MKRSHEIDMTNGPIFTKILAFSVPLMLTGILQLLFNAADVIVVGKFAGSVALAAVGSTGSLINLLVNVFIGISTGANVLAARFFGSQDHQRMHRCVHTAMLLSVFLGVFIGVVGAFLSGEILKLMNTDPEVLPLSTLYLRIYFIGIPATVVYNFGAAILRAIGDTDRPLRFLFISGVINVVLNLVTVIYLNMSVAGVAIATAVSQYVSAILVLLCLCRSEGSYRVHLKQLRLHKDMVGQILAIGLPAGLQSTIFSISNVLIQSTINSFGYAVMAGSSASASVEGFVYVAMNSVYHAALCFTSQNIGARKYDRLNKIIASCFGTVLLIGVPLSLLAYRFGPQLLSLYIADSDADREAVIAAGMNRMVFVCAPYFLCGLMEVFCGLLRGLGKAWTPLVISALGSCVLRIVWIYTIFQTDPTLDMLFISYPISWALTAATHCIVLFITKRKLTKQLAVQI